MGLQHGRANLIRNFIKSKIESGTPAAQVLTYVHIDDEKAAEDRIGLIEDQVYLDSIARENKWL